MSSYMWSNSNNAFFPKELLGAYANWDLKDIISVEDSIFNEYSSSPPEGKVRTSGSDGMPAWGDIYHEPLTNSQLLSSALSNLATAYKSDSYDLNMAYVAAIVNDGSSEAGKVTSVRSQITARKAQYISDIASAKALYPLE